MRVATLAQAVDATEAVIVDYDPLDPVVDTATALTDDVLVWKAELLKKQKQKLLKKLKFKKPPRKQNRKSKKLSFKLEYLALKKS